MKKIKSVFKGVFSVFLIGAMASCELLNFNSSISSSISSNESSSASSSELQIDYKVNEEEWKNALGFDNLKNANVEAIFTEFNSYINSIEETRTKYLFTEDSIKMSLTVSGQLDTEIYYDLSDPSVCKIYQRYISDGQSSPYVLNSLNNLTDKEYNFVKDCLLSTLFDLRFALLTDYYSIATFENNCYVIDGENLPYFMYCDQYNINNSIIKYHFENKQLVLLEYYEKDNEYNTMKLSISNIGNTSVDFDVTNVCFHEDGLLLNEGVYASLTNNSYHIFNCDDCGTVTVAHTYTNGVCDVCEYEYKPVTESNNNYDIEYLDLEGYPKNKIAICKDKETQKIVLVDFSKVSYSMTSSSNGIVIVLYGYNAYIEEKTVTEENVTKTIYSFYSYDTREFLKEIIVEQN